MEKYRYYIQHKYRQDSYLSKFSVKYGSCNWISLGNYTPNVSNYPKNYASIESMDDDITNSFMYEYCDSPVSFVDFSVMTEFQSMKIVRCMDNVPHPSKMYDIENQYMISPEIMIRRAAWKFNAFRTFTPAIAEMYEHRTKMKERYLGSDSYYREEYYIDLRPYIKDKYELFSKISDLGIIVYPASDSVLIIDKDENLNLCKLTIEGFHKLPIYHTREFLSLEGSMAHSNPIPLNFG